MRRLAFASTAAAGGVAWLSQDYQSGPARTARSLCCGVAIGIDYKVAGRLPHGSDEHVAAMREAHERGAQRLLALCRAHGGLYNKLGQYLASMTSALPPQYTSTLSACQDRAAPVALVEVRETVETQLGAPLASLFAEFDDAPVAAASLAQVHRAVLSDGRSVAVKVQYPRVAGQVASDLGSMRLLSALAEAAFPGAGYGWIIGEFEASTREELDFRKEAANAAACAALFAAEPRVHVPATDPSLSGERVLTMEWVDGAKLDDPAALLAAGVQPAEVAPLLTATFSAMVFEHGFVHCDPHAGNLLARRMPQAGARDGRGGGGGGGGGGAQLAHRSRPSRSHTHTRAHARTHTHSLTRAPHARTHAPSAHRNHRNRVTLLDHGRARDDVGLMSG